MTVQEAVSSLASFLVQHSLKNESSIVPSPLDRRIGPVLPMVSPSGDQSLVLGWKMGIFHLPCYGGLLVMRLHNHYRCLAPP
ncbi:hypothetical protein DPMN_009403 [Dreissena polymorpha]|uniref:Uncharacterized protein n=1 Tax=Dreissena polymorpha TaxID=45954 RepID=A0A9D4MY02_DREPO|nr:hypothetical protein DPMN_009403 [Dreissena polymorpha]